MKKEAFISSYRSEMSCVQVSAQLRRRTLDLMERKEKRQMKKRGAAVLAMILLLLLGAAGVAAVHHAGMLDFAGRFVGAYVPQDAQNYVQNDLLSMENELVKVEWKELYYDGYLSRMTADIIPKDSGILLLSTDIAPDDNWQNMLRMTHQWDDADKRTVADWYSENGYHAVYAVELWFEPDMEEISGGMTDAHLNEDGTLTIYDQTEYGGALPVRKGRFCVCLTPYQTPLTADSQRLADEKILLERPFEMKEAAFEKTVWVSTDPQIYESVGVRVDEIRIEQHAHEIHTTITAIIVDQSKYEAMEDGLWFEFIDPTVTTGVLKQRLKAGMSGTGSIVWSGDRMVQTGTLGREELHETYTLRAYNCWNKERYEAYPFSVKKVK